MPLAYQALIFIKKCYIDFFVWFIETGPAAIPITFLGLIVLEYLRCIIVQLCGDVWNKCLPSKDKPKGTNYYNT